MINSDIQNSSDDGDNNCNKKMNDGLNHLTRLAGLSWNINSIRKMMERYYEISETKKPMFRKSEVAMTALLQELTKIITASINQYTKVGPSGLRRISLVNMKIALQLDDELNYYYGNRYQKFDPSHDYELKITSDEISYIIHRVDTSDNKMQFTAKAKNFFNFLLMTVFEDLMDQSVVLINYADGKSISGRTIKYCAKLKFNGVILNRLISEVNRVLLAVQKEKDMRNNDNENENENDQEPDQDQDQDQENDKQ
jgi:hypothetical protein